MLDDQQIHKTMVIDLADEDVVAFYVANQETVQDVAETNFGRKLTEKELKRIECALIEEDDAFGLIRKALATAIEFAMNNSAGKWDKFDLHSDEPQAKYRGF
ncbi:MAG: hypothetical protein KGJ89_00160 [Patescibacteria group bacterium]|nr:hypothetical protein [Patescibacteria group bacterium]MDE2014934.1 hypothetical protein [Patescibacteria group bacterium]MDE2226363.1 hypothetical protein [Patescibacteria group bacterium]